MFVMKKLIATLSAAVVASAGLLSLSACGTAEVTYSVSEDGTYYILSGVSGSKSALTSYEIPSSYDDGVHGELPVQSIGDSAFMGTSLYRVSIPDTVTRIENYAFAYSKIGSVDIPSSVTYIGYAAFASCTALEEVVIPSSVTALGPYSFAYCTSLARADVQASVDTIYIGTFMGMVANDNTGIYTNTKLTEIHFPSTLRYLHRESISGNFLTDIYFDGTENEWQEVQVFYAEERAVEDGEEGETEIVTVYLDEEQTIEYFSVDGMTIHCKDADLTYSGGQIHITNK